MPGIQFRETSFIHTLVGGLKCRNPSMFTLLCVSRIENVCM